MRESEKKTERNTNSREEGEGEWIFVSRRKKTSTLDGRPKAINDKGSHSTGEFWRKKKAATIFIDNLPLFYDPYLLKRLCQGLGRVLHAHVPWKKRERSKTRYGFVIFERVGEAELAVGKLNGVHVFGHKLLVELSFNGGFRSFSGVQYRGKEKEGSSSKHVGAKNSFIDNGRSFAQVVKNSNLQWVKKKKEDSTCCVESEMIKREEFLIFQKDNSTKLASIEGLCLALKKDLECLLETISDICKEGDSMEGVCHNLSVEGEEEGEGSKVEGVEVSFVPESKEDGRGEERLVFDEGLRVEKEGGHSISLGRVGEEGEGVEGLMGDLGRVREEGVRDREEGVRTDTLINEGEEESWKEGWVAQEEERCFNLKKKEGKRSVLGLNPYSLKYGLSGMRNSRKIMKRKKTVGGVNFVDVIIGSDDISSRTVSHEPVKGVEHSNRYDRAMKAKALEEAYKTVDLGKKVGVSFGFNEASAIEKLLDLDA